MQSLWLGLTRLAIILKPHRTQKGLENSLTERTVLTFYMLLDRAVSRGTRTFSHILLWEIQVYGINLQWKDEKQKLLMWQTSTKLYLRRTATHLWNNSMFTSLASVKVTPMLSAALMADSGTSSSHSIDVSPIVSCASTKSPHFLSMRDDRESGIAAEKAKSTKKREVPFISHGVS